MNGGVGRQVLLCVCVCARYFVADLNGIYGRGGTVLEIFQGACIIPGSFPPTCQLCTPDGCALFVMRPMGDVYTCGALQSSVMLARKTCYNQELQGLLVSHPA